MKLFIVWMALWSAQLCLADSVVLSTLDPLADTRRGDVVQRAADGSTQRSRAVVNAFRKLYACPSTGQRTGACPGWAIDHVIPLICGGRDMVINMQWLSTQIKSAPGAWNKDHFERRVYGGRGISTGCP